MSKPFHLKILTPEKVFYDGQAQAVSVTLPDGEFTFLADHAPLIAPLEIGTLRYKTQDGWTEAFNSRGFVEAHHDGVVIHVQACELPEDIDRLRAAEAVAHAKERLRQKQSQIEYKTQTLALARAMGRLRISKPNRNV